MSIDEQRGRTAQPANLGGAVPGTTVALPTELTHVEPTRIDEETQQGSTQPGNGTAMRVVLDPPSWKEKVVGYAKKIRGTMLRRPETKEHGGKILGGQATVNDPNQVPDKTGRLQESN